MGYYCALWTLSALLEFNSLVEYLFIIFFNLANLFTIIVFLLQFKYPFKKLLLLQFIAFISSCYWIVFSWDHYAGINFIGNLKQFFENLSNLYIGYWNWLFSILFMFIAMFAATRTQKNERR